MKLQLAERSHKPDAVVELRTEDGQLVATVSATEDGLRIVSKYIVNHPALVMIEVQEPPALRIDLTQGMVQEVARHAGGGS
jgi:hypothetical protein